MKPFIKNSLIILALYSFNVTNLHANPLPNCPTTVHESNSFHGVFYAYTTNKFNFSAHNKVVLVAVYTNNSVHNLNDPDNPRLLFSKPQVWTIKDDQPSDNVHGIEIDDFDYSPFLGTKDDFIIHRGERFILALTLDMTSAIASDDQISFRPQYGGGSLSTRNVPISSFEGFCY